MRFSHPHLLGIEALAPSAITTVLDLAGLTQINMFFESSTRTQASFELAGKRLGADVMSMAMEASSLTKGETLIDTALTLNAMHPDLLVVRHPQSGAVDLLAQKVNCAVLNAGDGRHGREVLLALDVEHGRLRGGDGVTERSQQLACQRRGRVLHTDAALLVGQRRRGRPTHRLPFRLPVD